MLHVLWPLSERVVCRIPGPSHSSSQISGFPCRIFRRLFRGLRLVRAVRPGVWVLSPLVWPGGNHGFALLLSRLMLRCSVALMFRASFPRSLVVDLQPFDVALSAVEGLFTFDLSRS